MNIPRTLEALADDVILMREDAKKHIETINNVLLSDELEPEQVQSITRLKLKLQNLIQGL